MRDESRRTKELWTLRSAAAAAELGILDHYRRFERRVDRIFGDGHVALYSTRPGCPPRQQYSVGRIEGKKLHDARTGEVCDHANDAIASALVSFAGDGPPGPHLHIMETRPRVLILLLRLRPEERGTLLRELLAEVCQRCGRKRCTTCTAVHPGLGIPQILAERGKVRLYHTGDPSDLSGKVPMMEMGRTGPITAPDTAGIPNDLMTAASSAADRWLAGRRMGYGATSIDDLSNREALVRFIAAEMVQVVAHSKR